MFTYIYIQSIFFPQAIPEGIVSTMSIHVIVFKKNTYV